MSSLGDFLGSAVGEGAAFAAGIAIGPILAPLLKALENETWQAYPDQPLNAQTIAQAYAEGKIDLSDAEAEAALTGISNARFAELARILLTGPGIAEGLNLIRRGQLSPTAFPTILQRAGLEVDWQTAYQQLSSTGLQPYELPLSPADIALGLIRNNLNQPAAPVGPWFPPGGSSEGSNVPLDPISDIDVVAEAAASGMGADRMATLARNVGLPPGVIEGLEMLRRGLINEAAFYLLIEQSDARLSWGPFLIELRHAIFTAHEAADMRLRGWITTDQMYAIGTQNGYSNAQMDLLLDDTGRSLAVHQITTGLARGGTWDGTPGTAPEPYLSGLEQSNIRPEWYPLAYANRYVYPGYFVLKPLVASGAITVEQCTDYFLYQGWEPTLAALAAQSFATTAAGGGTNPVTSAKTSLVTAAKKAYVGGAANAAQTTTALQAAGLTADEISQWFVYANAQAEIEKLAPAT